jgi:hypothetical protein
MMSVTANGINSSLYNSKLKKGSGIKTNKSIQPGRHKSLPGLLWHHEDLHAQFGVCLLLAGHVLKKSSSLSIKY